MEIYIDLDSKKTHISWLSNEILKNIFEYLTISDFKNLLRTCKYISEFGRNDFIWEKIAEREAADIYPYKPSQVDYKWLCLAKVGSMSISRSSLYIYGQFNGPEHNPLENGIAISKRENKILSGEFKDGELNGSGTCWLRHKDNGTTKVTYMKKYEGKWVDGKKNGHGLFYWKNGDYYVGEWKNDHSQGKGKYIWKCGSYYEGNFDMNQMSGTGTYT